MADCRSNYSYIRLQHYEYLSAGIVNSVHDHRGGVDARFDFLHNFNVLGASSFLNDARDIRVLVCLRSTMQSAIVWKEADKVTDVS